MRKRPSPLAIKERIDFNLSVKLLNVLKSVGIALFLITVIGVGLDQLITVKMENLLMNPQGTSQFIWILGLASLLLNLTYPLLFLLVALSGFSNQKVGSFVGRNWNQTMIEEMRVWGKSMLWSLVFIIPGLVQFLRLVFVPFIVTMDPKYAEGSVDALEKSKQLSRGKIGRILALFIAFSIVIPMLFTSVDEYKLLWKTPLSGLFICFVEMVLNLCFILGLWKLYQLGSSPASKENL